MQMGLFLHLVLREPGVWSLRIPRQGGVFPADYLPAYRQAGIVQPVTRWNLRDFPAFSQVFVLHLPA